MLKISIIIPVYNKSKYLDGLLANIYRQTFPKFECIIIDDGSTDASGAICDKYMEKDNRFNVFHIENQGVSHARNIGIDMAKGEYITFIDADDEVHLNYLENLITCIEKEKVDMVIGAYKKFDDKLKEEEVIKYSQCGEKMLFSSILSDFVQVQKETGIFGCCVAKIFKRSLIQSVRFDENFKLAEDLDFYLRVYPKIKTIYFDDKPYYYYRQQADNSSSLVNDYDIDYLAQLNININFKNFLVNMHTYFGSNKELIDKIIINYMYFSIFYCPMNLIDSRLRYVSFLQNKEDIKLILTDESVSQKIIFILYKYNFYRLIKFIMFSYRKLKKIER